MNRYPRPAPRPLSQRPRPGSRDGVRSRRPWMSVALGLVLGFTAASWLIAPQSGAEREEETVPAFAPAYGRSAAGPGAQQPLPRPHARQRPGRSPPPARQELRGPQLPEAAPGVTSFRSSPWQQPPPLRQRRRGRDPKARQGSGWWLKGTRGGGWGAAGHRRRGQPGVATTAAGTGAPLPLARDPRFPVRGGDDRAEVPGQPRAAGSAADLGALHSQPRGVLFQPAAPQRWSWPAPLPTCHRAAWGGRLPTLPRKSPS